MKYSSSSFFKLFSIVVSLLCVDLRITSSETMEETIQIEQFSDLRNPDILQILILQCVHIILTICKKIYETVIRTFCNIKNFRNMYSRKKDTHSVFLYTSVSIKRFTRSFIFLWVGGLDKTDFAR